jgi:hypothetical protein
VNQIFRFLPALRVHSWGGFGSQLFTAYVVLKLQKKFPNRRIKVVIHTSGVTRRISEFDFEILGVQMIQVEDYKATDAQNDMHRAHVSFSYNLPKAIRRHLYQILQWLRLVQSANTDLSLNLISTWTLSIRGHYTRLSLDKLLVERLYVALFSKEPPFITQKNELVVHYRLGDLLNLDEKRPINVDRVECVLNELRVQTNHLVLLSDSDQEEMADFLKNSKILKFCKPSNYGPNNTLRVCIDAESFVGTGAKISLWAAIFRYFIHERESYLPTELNWSSGSGLKVNWY